MLQLGIYEETRERKLQFNVTRRSHGRNTEGKGNSQQLGSSCSLLLWFLLLYTEPYHKMPSKKALEALKAVNSIVSFSAEDQASLEATIEDYFTVPDPNETSSDNSDSDEDNNTGKNLY